MMPKIVESCAWKCIPVFDVMHAVIKELNFLVFHIFPLYNVYNVYIEFGFVCDISCETTMTAEYLGCRKKIFIVLALPLRGPQVCQ